ncbi:MAG: Alanine--tRNA ligase [Candidatus Anoxychlamydiales bacterium]|nr:Alanine--tRNA ligase [Candidatus Anoxychlamydiales bacterium]
MISNDIRTGFLNYFKKNSHKLVPSSPVFPHDDPTLLFINAGMNQFKDVFLGIRKRPYTKATSSQKCIRAGGKHNDLENVGFTKRHLTFFEMLGNFSFGDYFKKEAIAFAFDVTKNVFGFDMDKVWVSVYKDDDDSFALWEKYIPKNRIVKMGKEDNFWAMGDTGPCGPCSELYYDLGDKISDAKSPADDISGDRYLEFWNLVFMQYNQQEDGSMIPLPKPCVDTGAGLERVIALKMGVDNIFHIDIFQEIIKEIEKISNKKYDKNNIETYPAFHVIADHIRTLAFSIADGIMPSNVDKGYVIRKILRRAFRYGKILGLNKPFLAKLLPTVIHVMGDSFEELKINEKRTKEIITLEEESFIKNLERGGNILNDIIKNAKNDNKIIKGEDAFKLKDTYGFPVEEVLLIAKDEHLQVDLKTFNKLEEEAKERSRSAMDKVSQRFDENFFSDFSKTHPPTIFVGHHDYECESKIISIIKGDHFTDELKENELGILVLDKTSFYAEKGGQIGDSGVISFGNDEFIVKDTQEPFPGVITHIGKVKKGSFTKQKKILAKINIEKRKNIERNHSATHLLHYALQKVLGEHIKQKGSLVDDTRLRFDFDHHKALSKKEIREIERLINKKIRENIKVSDYEISYEDAQMDKSIKQFFGEKYFDKVRVIDMEFSKELCGGSHTKHTGELGYFRIFKESSIAAGIRRIEAVSASYAEDFVYDSEDLIESIANTLKVPTPKLEEKIQSITQEIKDLQKELKSFKKLKSKELIKNLIDKKQKVGKFDIVFEEIEMDPKELISFTSDVMNTLKSGIVVLATKLDSKCQFAIQVANDAIENNIFANDLIKTIAPLIQGGGGGKKDQAQAGGKDNTKIKDAFEALKTHLEST